MDTVDPLRRRLPRTLVPVAAVVILGVGLVLHAWRMDRVRRETATRTVEDYADFAAFLVGARVEAVLSEVLLYAFRPVELAEREERTAPVGPAELAADPQEVARCEAAYPDGDRWFARFALPSGALEVLGPLDAEGRAELVQALRRAASEAPAERTNGHVFLPGHPAATRPVAYRLGRDGTGRVREIHALASCWETRTRSTFERAWGAGGLLPPTLVGIGPPDSLLQATVLGPGGEALWRSATSYDSGFVGEWRFPSAGGLSGATLRTTLRPTISEALVIGGIPPSRWPFYLGSALTLALLAWITVSQVRRTVTLARTRERFVADVSHELRTPLQQILLFTQLLRMRRLPEGRERDEAVGIVERETLRLIQMVERVLAFSGGRGSRNAGGRADMPRTDAVRVIRETVEGFAPVAESDGTVIETELPAQQVPVRGREGELRQLLLNLLDNAVKYGRSGQTVRVELAATDPAGVELRVTDQGPGIPPADRGRVWEPFFRLEREEIRARTGSGIGLALVRDAVEAMGGSVAIEDGPDGGARFVVRLVREA